MINRHLSPMGAAALIFAITLSLACPPLAIIAGVVFVLNIVSQRDRHGSAAFEAQRAAQEKAYDDFLAAGRRIKL